jgi:Pyruvate/2-oxoacid:ferredoxin oxidoreductase gamma subunit
VPDDATRFLPPRPGGVRPEPDRARAVAEQQFDLVAGGLAAQGVEFLAEVVAAAARLERYPVQYWLDDGEGRGDGAIRAHLRIGPGTSPKVPAQSARLLVALETGEAERLAPLLVPGGLVVLGTFAWPTLDAKLGRAGPYPDAPAVARRLQGHASRVITLDLARLAAEGAAPDPAPPVGEAVVALGAMTALTNLIDRESVVRVIRERAGAGADAAVEACLAGYRAVAGHE